MEPSRPRGNPTARRRRQVRWAKRLRRVGLAWQNALEIARAGRLTAPYGFPFEIVHQQHVYKLRHYQRSADPGITPIGAPLLLVPPLMVASEVYDISPDVSAVAYLSRQGVDVWLVDFGAPEREEGGMDRTLDDHVRAVSEAIDRVRAATGKDVHLAGYSQGGMFCYQAAAFRRSAGLASIITAGSPVDLHRQLKLNEDVTERLVAGLRAALSWPLAHIEGLPGMFTSTGFKLLSARKEAMQLLDFVRKLHDRQALEKREAKRLFLGGEGFVAWPGPAFRKFVDDVIVGNRLASGGFVIDGHTVTLADLTCPILYFVGSRDEMGRPSSVRGIRRAAPQVDQMYEVPLKAGHFGLVVGSAALTVTWPSVVDWMKWREGTGAVPQHAFDVRAANPPDPFAKPDDPDVEDHDDHDDDSPLDLAKELVEKTAKAALDRIEELSEDLGSYLDNARWQVPRLARLRNLQDDSLVSLGRSLSEQAAKIGDRTFFLWRGRAFTYAEANRRVDAVVRGLIACGVKSGSRVGVMMKSRPSHLSIVTAINRLGAVAVLLSPETPDDGLPRALDLGEPEVLIVDPDSAARARAATTIKVMVLGGVGEPAVAPGTQRRLPAGVIDMESIDPDTVTLPAWYRADAGRARDLAMIFVSSGRHEAPRAMRITNRRWAFSALGAAAAATLTTRDTVYCSLPLHHPSGTLVAAGSALAGGARLALSSSPRGLTPSPSTEPLGSPPQLGFDPQTFWDEVRRYGVSVVFYAGEMCRKLVDAEPVLGEKNNPVRLFAGSGMRQDVWRRLIDRFGPVGVLELYASTEANAVLANASGKKIGSVGRPLPGSPEVAVAAWSFADDDFVREGAGRLVRARLDEPGMLVAKLARAGADIAHIDPRRLLRDAFEAGDTWFVTGDFMRVDSVGDYWWVDRQGQMVKTRLGAVASTRIEDAIYDCPSVALCIAVGRPDPDDPTSELPIAAIELHHGEPLDLEALSAATRALPEYARPRRIRVVEHLPMTDGWRPIKRGLRDLDLGTGPVYHWDPRSQRYTNTVEPTPRLIEAALR
ncbi:MAG: Polyhydroxyalkanoic acid synthase [Myxococcales bacterium]|nr:Polyhydroxyalkanoic acid synthase [Myxococcales bacterium]